MPGSQWCYNHDPQRAAQRQHNASKGGKAGGRGRPGVEVGWVKDLLASMIDEVRAGTLDPGKAYAVNALLNTQLRAIELARKLREADELAARIEVLEDTLAGGTGIAGIGSRKEGAL